MGRGSFRKGADSKGKEGFCLQQVADSDNLFNYPIREDSLHKKHLLLFGDGEK